MSIFYLLLLLSVLLVYTTRLINAIKAGSVSGEVTPGENMKEKRRNIERFLQAVTNYGLSGEKLFDVDDLLLLQNIPRVTACLFELGGLVKQDTDYSGPYLGHCLTSRSIARRSEGQECPKVSPLRLSYSSFPSSLSSPSSSSLFCFVWSACAIAPTFPLPCIILSS